MKKMGRRSTIFVSENSTQDRVKEGSVGDKHLKNSEQISSLGFSSPF